MTFYGYFMLAFSLLLAGLMGSFSYREGLQQLAVIVLFLPWFFLLFISVALLPWRSWGARFGSAGLLILFATSPLVGARIGSAVRDSVFRSRLPEYELAVQAVRAGTAPSIIPRLANHITQRTTPGGDLEVTFFWGGGLPAKHTAFVYRSADPHADQTFTQSWPSIRALAPKWYVVRD